MKACVLEAVGKLIYKEVPTPTPKENELLIKIGACGICSSDFTRVNKTGTYHFPTIPGHEFSGRVVSAGSKANHNLIGKKVVIFPLIPCLSCESCKHQLWAQCKKYDYKGSRSDGGFAEYVVVPEWNIREIPDNMPFEIAALAEPAAVALHAIKCVSNLSSKTIAISGSGTIALLAGFWAKQLGAKDVSIIYRSSAKQKFIEYLGLTPIHETQLEKSNPMDVLVECVGSVESIQNCVKQVKSNGTIILVGNPSDDIVLPKDTYWKILRSELHIQGVWNSSWKSNNNDDWETTINLLCKHSDKISALITQKYSLADAMKPFLKTDCSSLMIKGMYVNE